MTGNIISTRKMETIDYDDGRSQQYIIAVGVTITLGSRYWKSPVGVGFQSFYNLQGKWSRMTKSLT